MVDVEHIAHDITEATLHISGGGMVRIGGRSPVYEMVVEWTRTEVVLDLNPVEV